jgi:hypothetical protein
MNALLYLLLRIKSNSRHDAELFTEHLFPIIQKLEESVSKAKVEYDTTIKPIQEKIDKLTEEMNKLEVAEIAKEDKEVDKAIKKSKKN